MLRYVEIISDYRHGMLRGSQLLCGFKAQAARRAVVSVIEARGTSPLGSIRCDRMRDSKDWSLLRFERFGAKFHLDGWRIKRPCGGKDIAKIEFKVMKRWKVTDSHCESSGPKVKVLFGWLKSVASVVVLTHDSPMMFVAFSEARWTYGGGKKINFPMWVVMVIPYTPLSFYQKISETYSASIFPIYIIYPYISHILDVVHFPSYRLASGSGIHDTK